MKLAELKALAGEANECPRYSNDAPLHELSAACSPERISALVQAAACLQAWLEYYDERRGIAPAASTRAALSALREAGLEP